MNRVRSRQPPLDDAARRLQNQCRPPCALVRTRSQSCKRPPAHWRAPSHLLFTTTGRTAFLGVSKALDCLNQRAANYKSDGEPLKPWRLHDLRRMFASGCARHGVQLHVVEKALSHTGSTFGGIVRVYQRHEFFDERQHTMDIWAAHIMGLASPRPANKEHFVWSLR